MTSFGWVLACLAALASAQQCPTSPVTLTNASGVIELMSPEYRPLPFPMQCRWWILAGQGQQVHVELVFEDVRLSSDCSFATLSVFDGPDDNAPMLVPASCGQGPNASRVETSGATAAITLSVEEKSLGNRGIRIRYKLVDAGAPDAIDCLVGTCPGEDGQPGSSGAQWSNCSSICGGGQQNCLRPILRQAEGGGKPCPSYSERLEIRDCNLFPCPSTNDDDGSWEDVDCIMGSWGPWGPCTPYEGDCGSGSQEQTREILRPASGNGKPCNATVNTNTCTVPCAADDDDDAGSGGGGGGLDPGLACSSQGGVVLPGRNGTLAVGEFEGTTPLLPLLQCEWHLPLLQGERGEVEWNWVDVGASSFGLCLIGTVSVVEETQSGDEKQTLGSDCSLSPSAAAAVPVMQTASQSVAGVKITLTTGPDFGAGFGSGFSLSYRIRSPPSPSPIPTRSPNTSASASPSPFPRGTVDCKVSDWSQWSACNASCGVAYREHSRQVVQEPSWDGKPCPDLVQTARCWGLPPCGGPGKNVDCNFTWSDWSPCDAACGSSGHSERHKIIHTEPQGNGTACGDMVDTQTCQGSPCPDPDAGLPAACTAGGGEQLSLTPADTVEVALGPRFLGAPEGYHPPGLDCLWHVSVPTGTRLLINVTRLHLKRPMWSSDCTVDEVLIKGGTKLLSLCGASDEPQQWQSDGSSVELRFTSQNGTWPILGDGFTVVLHAEPEPAPRSEDVARLTWNLGAGPCDQGCQSRTVILKNLISAVAKALGVADWRVSVASLEIPAGRVGDTTATVQLLPDVALAATSTSETSGQETATALLQELWRQLTVAEEERLHTPIWLITITSTSKPETLAVSYSEPGHLVIDPRSVNTQILASDMGRAKCGNQEKKAQVEFTITNAGAADSSLVLNSVSKAAPLGPPAVGLSVSGFTEGSSLAGGEAVQVQVDVLPCTLAADTVGPVLAAVHVYSSDVLAERTFYVQIDIERHSPTPAPPAPSTNPSPSPGAGGTTPSSPTDWLQPKVLVAAGAGAGACLVVGILGYVCCRRCCCKQASKPTGTGGSSGARSTGPSARAAPTVERGDSGVLAGVTKGSRGSDARTKGRGRGRGGSSDEEDGEGIELAAVHVDEDASDAFESLTKPEDAADGSSAWEPPVVSGTGGRGWRRDGREAASPSSPPHRPSSAARGARGGASELGGVFGSNSSSSSSSVPVWDRSRSGRQQLRLEAGASLAADEFEGRWSAATASDFFGGTVTAKVAKHPEALEDALRRISVTCIASGEVGGVHKQFYFAKEQGTGRLFMAEFSITTSTRHLSGMVRTEGSGGDALLAQFSGLLQKALKPVMES